MKRIAMWSGPRNLSTAMMYSFASRPDCTAVDEPFYAAYLAQTNEPHPMQDQILSAHETDPEKIAQQCEAPQAFTPLHYQKHMCHHMLPDFPTDWAKGCTNIFLIRHPARVIASYTAKRAQVTLADLGLVQQLEFFDQFGGLVIDSADIRANPEQMLRLLCDRIDIPFDQAMLKWSVGPKAFDGIWASHWYGSAHASTGFAAAEGPLPDLSGSASELLESALPLYQKLHAKRLLT